MKLLKKKIYIGKNNRIKGEWSKNEITRRYAKN